MDYVFRLEKGCFGEENGGHVRAMGHWGTVLECGFENAVNQGWHGRAREHGVAVPNYCPQMLGFCTVLWCFWCFYILAFWDVFGCDVGHLKALALIPIDVYVGGK